MFVSSESESESEKRACATRPRDWQDLQIELIRLRRDIEETKCRRIANHRQKPEIAKFVL